MDAEGMEKIIKQFRWELLQKMYGCAHSSIIGFISTEWVSLSPDENPILDGAPSPIIGKGRDGQKNADILLCKADKPLIPVEVETQFHKYKEKLDSLLAYINNRNDFDGIDFGILFMTNLCNGPTKYKHNWDNIKKVIKEEKKCNIVLVSVIKEKASLKDTVLDTLRKRNDYFSWDITSIDYWIHDEKGVIKEGNLWSKI